MYWVSAPSLHREPTDSLIVGYFEKFEFYAYIIMDGCSCKEIKPVSIVSFPSLPTVQFWSKTGQWEGLGTRLDRTMQPFQPS